MKIKIFLALLGLSINYSSHAQQGIVVTGADVTNGSNQSVTYSVGQLDYAVANGSNGTAYAGLQQPFEISDLTDIKNIGETLKMKLYPNPALDKLIIENETPSKSLLKAKLISSAGKLISTQALNGTSNEIAVSGLNPGAYLVEIRDQNENKIKTYSIIKK